MSYTTIGNITLNPAKSRLLESALQMGLMSILEELTNDKGELQDITYLALTIRELNKAGLEPKDIKLLVDKLLKGKYAPTHEAYMGLLSNTREMANLVDRQQYEPEAMVRKVRQSVQDVSDSYRVIEGKFQKLEKSVLNE